MPKVALPSGLSGVSSRFVGLPTSLKSLGFFGVTFWGGSSFDAFSTRLPNDARWPPEITKPFSVRQLATSTFHLSAAAAINIWRAAAPALRTRSHSVHVL